MLKTHKKVTTFTISPIKKIIWGKNKFNNVIMISSLLNYILYLLNVKIHIQ
jgi:hypothetical protein